MALASFAPSREPCSTSSKKNPLANLTLQGVLGTNGYFILRLFNQFLCKGVSRSL